MEKHDFDEVVEDEEMEVEDILEEQQVEDTEDEASDGEIYDPEEWEEVTMIVTVNGILDADLVRDAVERNLIKLRYADTDAPVLQINNSLYTAVWNQDLGTNMVLQSTGKEMEVVSCTSTMMTAEKALLTSLSTEGSTIAAKAEIAPRAALSRTQPRGK
uniref:TFIIIC_sub6 domain-containing protein n=1 Tax=Caenorhabditis tropicalis TaxID=1561998 RepID=A0A1I7TJY6_9PELO